MWSVIRGEMRGLNFLVGVYPTEGENSNLLACRGSPHPNSIPEWDILISPYGWITLRRVLRLFTVMILKIVSESIFFKSNKFNACKIKDGKEVANSLMIFNLLKIIHPFKGKKHLRT